MILPWLLNILSAVSLSNGWKIKATRGEEVTLCFPPVDEVEKLDVNIFFRAKGKKEDLIAKYRCHHQRCDVLEKSGVSLRVKGGNVTLTLQHVNRSTNAGVYVAQIFIGKHVIERKITLVVSESPSAFTSFPAPTSGPKPPDSHERQRLYVFLPLGIMAVLVVTLGLVYLFFKYKYFCQAFTTATTFTRTPNPVLSLT